MKSMPPPDIQPPELQNDLPVYPQVAQVVRVASPSIGSNVYPGFVAQYSGSLTFRDREACYVWEPNGIALSPGYYDARLVGSYLTLPIYEVTCCPTGSFSSVSAGS